MTHILRIISIVLFAGLVAACGQSLSGLPPVSTANADQYRLAPGDELRVMIPGLTGVDVQGANFVVNDRGEITLPLMGSVPVNGRTIPEVEGAIAAQLVRQQLLVSPTVSIQPVRLRPIYVLGEVRNPGEYSYRPNMTVINAISLAGGYTFRANQKNVAIIRNVNGSTVTAQATETTPIQPGDTVRVIEKWF